MLNNRIFEPFADLFLHPRLFLVLLRRDLESTVRGSVLGIAWLIVTPLVLVAIYTFVFGIVLKSTWFDTTESQLDVPLIYFTGIILFAAFMEILTRAPDFLRNNATYVKKIVFPLALLDWVIVGAAAAKLVAGLGLLAIFLLFVKGAVPLGFFMIPLIVLPFLLLMTGLAWFFSAIGTYVRDINHLLLAVAPVLLFISPVFYDLSQVPADYHWVYRINPLTFVLENTRNQVFFDRPFEWRAYGYYWLAALIVFNLGFQFFKRAKRGFADVI